MVKIKRVCVYNVQILKAYTPNTIYHYLAYNEENVTQISCNAD